MCDPWPGVAVVTDMLTQQVARSAPTRAPLISLSAGAPCCLMRGTPPDSGLAAVRLGTCHATRLSLFIFHESAQERTQKKQLLCVSSFYNIFIVKRNVPLLQMPDGV